MYAWESADTGEEATPEQVVAPDGQIVDILCGKQEQHITADVAYAVWQYWQATEDVDFLLDAGAEILLETAPVLVEPCPAGGRWLLPHPRRHRTGRVSRAGRRQCLHQCHGPLEHSARRLRWPRCCANAGPTAGRASHTGLAYEDTELVRWRTVAETGHRLEFSTGLFEQFAGFFGLEEIDLAGYAGRSVPMDVVLGRERTQRSQVIKQADVVALLALLAGGIPR